MERQGYMRAKEYGPCPALVYFGSTMADSTDKIICNDQVSLTLTVVLRGTYFMFVTKTGNVQVARNLFKHPVLQSIYRNFSYLTILDIQSPSGPILVR